MSKRKRFLALCIALCLTFTACGNSAFESENSSVGTADNSGQSVSEEQEGTEGNNTAPNSTINTAPNSPDNTGRPTGEGLSRFADQYEGTEGTGAFNYGEALQKSFIFYELQRSGKLSGEERTNWRGDSGLNDGGDNGVDLTGGLYDAGDNAKFNLPMAFTASMLAWSVYEDYDSYEESGQLKYALSTIKWIDDYLIKCHTAENEYYYQVGDGSLDHSWWGPSEVMQMNRPSFKVTLDSPGSTVVGEAAAALAAAAVVFRDVDKEYSRLCLTHSKQLFDFAETTKSDSGYTAANGFYASWSGFYDELSWAAGWLYTATGDESYLNKSKEYFIEAGSDYKWALCWDDKGVGAALRLVQLTGDSECKAFLEKNLAYWTTGTNGERITYTPKGLAWLDSWGCLRYAAAQAFAAACYSECEYCPEESREAYWDFAVSQIDYALGSTGRSYVCGFGENYPQHPHHRTSHGSYVDNLNVPEEPRHILYGALVGGPDASDNYRDVVAEYQFSEVADDYNAGYTCALAKLYGKYKGKTLVNFGAVEPVGTEYEVEACVNAAGDNFTEIKAIVYNKTAWCARASKGLKLRYFINLSETEASGVTVKMGYSKDNAGCEIIPWDAENNVYCVQVDFGDTLIYPGGQDAYRSEVQFRISSQGAWDNSNDFSYAGLGLQQGTVTSVDTLALYDDGALVWGKEPDGEAGEPIVSNTDKTEAAESDKPAETAAPNIPSASEGGISVNLAGGNPQNNAISLNLELVNSGGEDFRLDNIEIGYFFTRDGGSPVFECYYSAVDGGEYRALSGVKGRIEDSEGTGCDSVILIGGAEGVLHKGEKWIINAAVHNSDWSALHQSNDFSFGNAGRIAVFADGELLFGETP